jgi:radical SAM superfamily enzyme YgiQ (UPF0313 family)
MRIALIEPPYRFKEDPLNQGMCNLPGIAFIGAVLKNQGRDIKIIDFKNDRNASLDDAFKSDIIGIASYINGYAFFKETLPVLKKAGKIIITGGPFISSYGNTPNNLLMKVFPEIDYAVIGEGEITTKKLIEALEDSSKPIPKGVLFREKNSVISTGVGDVLCNLDEIPEIDYADWQALVNNVKDNVLNAGFLRGCYNRCSFCYQMFKGVRSFSFSRIDAELEKMASFKPRQIMFMDTIFTYDKNRALEIAKLAHKHGLKYGIETRVSDIDYELMKELKESGCYHVHLGIESFDENLLKKANKNITLKQIYQAINDSQRAGVETIGFFLIGLPGENRASLEKTLRGIKDTRILPQPRILIPLPGTHIYKEALKQFSEPDKFDTKEGNWVPVNLSNGLTDQELIEARNKMKELREEFSDSQELNNKNNQR